MATESNIEFSEAQPPVKLTKLPFPPLTKSHIMNCSYHSWHPKYKSITPKARLIPLTTPFLDYLRADGIVLPEDNPTRPQDWSDTDSGIFSGAEGQVDDDDDQDADPATGWRDLHDNIKSTIVELGGKVVPKMNWSAPKDATWISATNSLECQSPTDIYLLLKSSDFVTHDIEHAFDDCVDNDESSEAFELTKDTIPYHLVLRKYVQLNPSVEFRCFVRNRQLIAICQRDLNHYEFLFRMENDIKTKIGEFFQSKLQYTFPDENFVFDVYIPPPHERVWLIDFNPWAIRTDPLIFSWLELLTMKDEVEVEGITAGEGTAADDSGPKGDLELETDGSESDDEVEELTKFPIFRLVHANDPEAYSFTTSQYSAHKLPKDVVDASRGGEVQLQDFANQWQALLDKQREQQDDSSDTE